MKLNFGEVILSALTPALEVITTAKLGELFDKMYAKDQKGHAAALKSLYIGVNQLERLTGQTKTKIDDAILGALVTAIETSAATYNVVLTA